MNARESKGTPSPKAVKVDWLKEIDEEQTETLALLLSSKGMRQRLDFLEFALTNLNSPKCALNEDSHFPILMQVLAYVLDARKGDWELGCDVAVRLYMRCVGREAQALQRIASDLMERIHIASVELSGPFQLLSLKIYALMLLFSVSDSTPAECHVLIEKVLQPVIANNREVIDAVEWPEDAEESQKKEEKLVEFLKSTCALISFVPRDKLRVILDDIFDDAVAIMAHTSETVRVAAAEMAMTCVDLMHNDHTHSWKSEPKTLESEVHRCLRETSTPTTWKLLASLLSNDDAIAVDIPFLRIDTANHLQLHELYSGGLNTTELNHNRKSPTTGYSEAIILQFVYNSLGGTFVKTMFDPTGLQHNPDKREFTTTIFDILTRSEASGDLRLHADNLMKFSTTRRWKIIPAGYLNDYHYANRDKGLEMRDRMCLYFVTFFFS